MQIIVRSKDDFHRYWNGPKNFVFDPNFFQFDMDLPSAEDIVDILRKDSDARVQFLSDELSESEKDVLSEKFKTSPLEEAIEMPFSLAHFYLKNFYGPGKFLEHFQDRVMIPWRMFLSQMGFTWQRCYPIFFISGRGCSSSFHVDVSHVLAWQVHGVKNFNGFKEPEKYAALDTCVNDRKTIMRITPPEVDPTDVLSYRMTPGDLLWNQLLTPHWVTAGDDEVAVSMNISHGGVSLHGNFCPHEQALRKRWENHPEEAWLVDARY